MTKNKKFYELIIPSIGVMLISVLYVVVDGIFIGQGLGVIGLAAVNISLPFISIMTAITMMITMGGATIVSIRIGKKNLQGANRAFNTSFKALIIFSLILILTSLLFSKKIAIFLGATNILIKDTSTYLKYYTLFSSFFCGSIFLSTFVRNDGNPKLSFYGMVIGAISNIFLDWLFIFPLKLGIKGAAIASGLGQLLTCFLFFMHFYKNRGVLKLNLKLKERYLLKDILFRGIPAFITQMGVPITTLCYNFIVLKYFHEIGISAYSIMNSLIVIATAIFLGVSQGIQPLISYNFGNGNFKAEEFYLKKGLKTNLILTISINIFILLFGYKIIHFFTSNVEVINLAFSSMKTYAISFIFSGINTVLITYYLSTKRTAQANKIACLRSFILNTLCIFLLPYFLGKNFIWLGIVLAEFLVTLFSIRITFKKN